LESSCKNRTSAACGIDGDGYDDDGYDGDDGDG
jgi:hypothetical protein